MNGITALAYKLPLALASGQGLKKQAALAEFKKKSIILSALAQIRLKPKGNLLKEVRLKPLFLLN